jgi:hypothetical protein
MEFAPGHPSHASWLLLVLLLATATATAFPWSLPDRLPELPTTEAWHDALLRAYWAEHKQQYAYCLGDELAGAQQLLKQSFPDPLPEGPREELVCSDRNTIAAHLCGPEEIGFLMQVAVNQGTRARVVQEPVGVAHTRRQAVRADFCVPACNAAAACWHAA